MSTITYKCPSCGAAIEYDGTSGMLTCHYCHLTMPVEEYDQKYTDAHRNSDSSQSYNTQNNNQNANNTNNHNQNNTYEDNNNSGEEVKIFHCQSCGAELVTDPYTSATICGFCGNPSLVEDRLEGNFKPKYIIPFKFDKNEAVKKYKSWVRKGLLTPRTLCSQSTIEKITGIYVPFWLYDFNSTDHMVATATRTRSEIHGEYKFVYTDHYSVTRDTQAQFSRIPADASIKMEDNLMDMLEPFNYNSLTDFSMPYLSGYMSEKYNFTDNDMITRVLARSNQYITDLTRNTIIGYGSVTIMNNQPSSIETRSDYALLPVWMLNYRFNGRDYKFLLNGETGKIVADRPISTLRAVVIGVIIFIIVLILAVIGGLLLKW